MVQEKSRSFSAGFLAPPGTRLPNTVAIPAPEPAVPIVAAPAPGNLAAVSMSLEMALVGKLQLGVSEVRGCGAAKLQGSHLSVSPAVLAPLQTVTGSTAETAPDREGGGDQLCPGSIFSG